MTESKYYILYPKLVPGACEREDDPCICSYSWWRVLLNSRSLHWATHLCSCEYNGNHCWSHCSRTVSWKHS